MANTEHNFSISKNLDNLQCRVDGDGFMNENMNLVAYIIMWMELFKVNSVRASTYDRLQTSLNALKGYAIANMAIKDITFFDIQRYINSLVSDGYSMSSVKKQIRIVTAPLKRAASLKIISSDPTVGIELPQEINIRKEAKEIVAYTTEEQNKLNYKIALSSLPAHKCCTLMMETGLRAGEALALRWRDVDLSRGKLSVRATVVNLANKKQSYVQNAPKSAASRRSIPLTPAAVSILKELKDKAKTEWVFENDGDRLSYESLRYRTQMLCADAGVKYRGEHVFRHTFATNCYYKGIDIKILSKMLGHADVATTYNTYINLYGDGFEDMRRALLG